MQVSHQTWPSGSLHASKKECRQEIHSGFETHEEGHTKSKTGAISGSTKWALVQKNVFFKKILFTQQTFMAYSNRTLMGPGLGTGQLACGAFTLKEKETDTKTENLSSQWHQWKGLGAVWTPSYNYMQAILICLCISLSQCKHTISHFCCFPLKERYFIIDWCPLPVAM